MTKLRFCSILVAAVMAAAMVFVSCSPTNIASDEDTVQVYFGSLQAKAIDETAYTASGSTTFGTANVQVGDTAAYYWTYAAVKADDYFTNGKTYDKGGTPVFVNCAEGTGLGSARTFSKGAWTFTLRAYASVADRTAGTQYIFEGSVTTASMTTSQAVAIPVSYSYVEGTGTASFTITTSIEQPEVDGVTTTYKVTKVEAVIGDTTKELTTSDDGATWTGTQSIASGIQTVGINVYVDNEDTARASNESLGTAIILHGLTNEITGSAKVTLTGADLSITFTSSTPSEQPSEDGFPIEVGDIIKLGTYPTSSTASGYNADYAGKPVTWKILSIDKTNNRALVISEKVLTTMKQLESCDPYNLLSTWTGYSKGEKTYPASLVNIWLNEGSFKVDYNLNNVNIISVEHETYVSESSSDKVTSSEKIFLLSYTEAIETKDLFTSDADRIAFNLDGTATGWWLRTPSRSEMGMGYNFESITNKGKEKNTGGYEEGIGVRPAFWINIE